jgi:peptidoglycan/LPS O-acetylase OafA/YrhL
MQPASGQRFYYPELDGLRFVAFLLVFIHNTPYIVSNPAWKIINEYGWIGVDLFFCLSAFLITKLLLTENENFGKINIRDFYVRRVLRIFPLYILYIVIALFFSLQAQKWNGLTTWHVVGLSTFTFNIVYQFLTPYIMPFFVHLWSISFEEQFYATIPLFLQRIIETRQRIKWLIFTLLFIIGFSTRAVFIYYQIEHPVIYMLPFTHFESILLGVAAGYGLFNQFLKSTKGWVLLLIGITLNILVFFLPNNYEITWNLLLTYPMVGLGMILIVLSVTKNENKFTPPLLNNKIISYLGKVSYGLYIWHILGNYLASIFISRLLNIPHQETYYPLAVFAIGFTFTGIFASLSYYSYERHFLKLKNQFSRIISRPI